MPRGSPRLKRGSLLLYFKCGSLLPRMPFMLSLSLLPTCLFKMFQHLSLYIFMITLLTSFIAILYFWLYSRSCCHLLVALSLFCMLVLALLYSSILKNSLWLYLLLCIQEFTFTPHIQSAFLSSFSSLILHPSLWDTFT